MMTNYVRHDVVTPVACSTCLHSNQTQTDEIESNQTKRTTCIQKYTLGSLVSCAQRESCAASQAASNQPCCNSCCRKSSANQLLTTANQAIRNDKLEIIDTACDDEYPKLAGASAEKKVLICVASWAWWAVGSKAAPAPRDPNSLSSRRKWSRAFSRLVNTPCSAILR